VLKRVELNQAFYSSLAVAIADEVLKEGGKVPVVTGYFGVVPGSLLSAIGRGYTDLCAALLAVGLGADELQIWKEVDGIFTADPRKVPTARLLTSITPEEAAELTFFGSEVFSRLFPIFDDRSFIRLFVNKSSAHVSPSGSKTLKTPGAKALSYSPTKSIAPEKPPRHTT